MLARTLALLTVVAATAGGQSRVLNIIGGGAAAKNVGGVSPDFGVGVQSDVNAFIAVGVETRFLQKASTGYRLGYLEVPFLVRLSDTFADEGARMFVHLGVAPALNLTCKRESGSTATYGNGIDTRRVVADPVGFTFHPIPSGRRGSCFDMIPPMLDLGVLIGSGAVFRSGMTEYGIEVRVTQSVRPLDAAMATGRALRQPYNHVVQVLMSLGTRSF